jgi:DNA-binding NarL/FixJ family response regulator
MNDEVLIEPLRGPQADFCRSACEAGVPAGVGRLDAEDVPSANFVEGRSVGNAAHGLACDERWYRDRQPAPDIALRPLLDSGWHAVAHMDGMKIAAATQSLRDRLQRQPGSLQPDISQEVDALLAIGSAWEDNAERALRHARAAGAARGGGRFRSLLVTVEKYCHWRMRDFAAFYRIGRERTVRTNAATVLAAVVRLSIEAATEAEQLRFRLSERLARHAILLSSRVAGAEANVSLLPWCVLAYLSYETGALEDVQRILTGRLCAIATHGSIESALLAFPTIAKLAHAQGDRVRALAHLRHGVEVGRIRGWPRLVVRCLAESVALLATSGQIDEARRTYFRLRRAADKIAPGNAGMAIDDWPLVLARAHLEISAGATCAAESALECLREAALSYRHRALAVGATILLAGALFAGAHEARAERELLSALRQGADTGLCRTFLDALPLIEPILRDLRRRSAGGDLEYSAAYLGSLLTHEFAAAPACAPAAAPISLSVRHNRAAMVDLLSLREMAVLRLIGLGLSNKNIGRELSIAPETVKSHVKSIFVKLATRTRAEAVSRAVERGLL